MREPRQATKVPSSTLTGFARATSFAPRYSNHFNALGLGATGANAIRPNPLLIQAIARTSTQFTHVFQCGAMRNSVTPRRARCGAVRGLPALGNGKLNAWFAWQSRALNALLGSNDSAARAWLHGRKQRRPALRCFGGCAARLTTWRAQTAAAKDLIQALFRFHQLDAIAEWIVDVESMVAFEGLVFLRRMSRRPELLLKLRKVRNEQCQVSLTRRPEIRLHTQMNLQVLSLEPTATALCKVGRFWYFLNPQHTLVESAGEILAAGRHR